MSDNNNTYTFQSSSYSSVSDNSGTHSRETYSDNSGTTVTETHKPAGEAAQTTTQTFDSAGNRLEGGQERGRIEDVTDEEAKRQQEENDRLYEERMEDEYAKREGGA